MNQQISKLRTSLSFELEDMKDTLDSMQNMINKLASLDETRELPEMKHIMQASTDMETAIDNMEVAIERIGE